MQDRYIRYIICCSFFLLQAPLSNAQAPANDDCAQAISVIMTPATGTCNSVTANTVNATTSNYLSNCWSFSYDDDVWYKFVATAEKAILYISNISVAGAYVGYAVFEDNCPDVGAEIACNSTMGGDNIVEGLTIGKTYYISVFFTGNVIRGTFQLCVKHLPLPPPPATNDDCSGAIQLTVASSAAACNAVTANTISAVPDSFYSNCAYMPDYETVWYRFTATDDTISLGVSNLSLMGYFIGYSLLTGNCSSLTEVRCGSTGSSSAMMTGLTVGQSYYLAVYYASYNTGGTFDICLYRPGPPPVNDNCSGAISLSIASSAATCNAVLANTTSATTGSYVSNCWSTSYDDDLWYKFTATSSTVGMNISNISAIGADIGYSLYDACPGSGSEVTCGTNSGGSNYFSGLTPGHTYYISVFFTGSGTTGTFNICLFQPSPPLANDDCSNAQTVAIASSLSSCNPIAVNTNGSYPSAFNSNCGTTTTFDDVWYKFVATASTVGINISNLSQSGAYIGYSVWDGCPPGGIEITCGTNAGNLTTITNLTPGQTYYLAVFYLGTNLDGTFDICLCLPPPPPANDDCSSASVIGIASSQATCNSTLVNTSSSTSSNFTVSCGTTTDFDDLWYRFTATSSSVDMNISNMSNSASSIGYAVFDGCPGVGTEVNCGVSGEGTSYIPGLIPGQTYYLAVFYLGFHEQGTFNLCLFQPPPPPANDNCSAATTIGVASSQAACNATLVNTISAVSSDFTALCGTTTDFDDVWYRFVATSSSVEMNITNMSVGGGYIGYAVFQGCPPSATEIDCGTNFGGTNFISGLTPGQTYYLSVFYIGYHVEGTFNLCLFTPPLPPVNDDCNNAIFIPVASSAANCISSHVNTNAGTPSTYISNCWSTSYDDDVWYMFTAPASVVEFKISNISVAGASIGYALFSDICPDNGVEFTCGISQDGVTQFSGLSVGTVYYLSVFYAGTSSRGTFDICLYQPSPPPVNDYCNGAISVPVFNKFEDCNPELVNTEGGTPAGYYSACWSTSYDDDVWYSFTATRPTVYVNMTNKNVSGGHVGFSVLSQCESGEVAYGDDLHGSSQLVSGLTTGNTYYLSTFYLGTDDRGTFNLCLTEEVPPVNPGGGVNGTFMLYPNPARSFVNIFFSSDQNNLGITIYDISGVAVFKRNVGSVSGQYNAVLDLRTLAKGFYIVQVVSDQVNESVKIVLQ